MQTLKIISTLMCYPSQELVTHGDAMMDIIRDEAIVPEDVQVKLCHLVQTLCQGDLLGHQAEYVETFDRGRAVSLLLFEHVHGESRDRGQAMVDLIKVYSDDGLELSAKELPDYIPLFLEYLSQCTETKALEGLANVQHIFALLAARLEARDSIYSVLFFALLALVDANVDNVDLEKVRAEVSGEKRDDTPEELDKIWEEEAVRFGNEQLAAKNQSQSVHEHRIPVDSIGKRH